MSDYESELRHLEAQNRRRRLRSLRSPQGRLVSLGGQTLLNVSSNDYLGLANHPKVLDAARAALDAYGHGAGAARLLVGNFDLAERLEAALVDWLGGERALLFSSGYHANLGVLPTLYRTGTVHSDSLNHASLIDGIRLSGATKSVYPHLSIPEAAPTDWIVTESLFSMDGDSPDLGALRQTGATLLVDEAHAFGVCGARGRGLADESADFRVGTMGKALGSYGAFVLGSSSALQLLASSARSFMFTTALPAPVLAASLAGVNIAASDEGDERRAHLEARAKRFRENMGELLSGRGPIFSLEVGREDVALDLGRRLEEVGILAQAIRPPTVPVGRSRLRIVLTASHTTDDVDRLSRELNDALRHSA